MDINKKFQNILKIVACMKNGGKLHQKYEIDFA